MSRDDISHTTEPFHGQKKRGHFFQNIGTRNTLAYTFYRTNIPTIAYITILQLRTHTRAKINHTIANKNLANMVRKISDTKKRCPEKSRTSFH